MNNVSKPRRVAIIDLGTNTFHLLIVERNGQHFPWNEVFRKREYVKLGSGGIKQIEPSAFERARSTMKIYRQFIDEHHVTEISAFGTAGLRRASNAPELIDTIKQNTGIEVDVISGDQEAQLIADGISLSLTDVTRPYLIMDIGGGSVEFILCQRDRKIVFAQSFPIGVAILHHKFNQSDPISKEEMTLLRDSIAQTLSPLFGAMDSFGEMDIVGASGTFDVLADVLDGRRLNDYCTELSISSFHHFFKRVIPKSLKERLEMSEIPEQRADLIVVALLLIKLVLDHHAFERIIVSKFALKEGVLKRLFNI